MAYRYPECLLSKSLLVSLVLSYVVFCLSLVFLLSLYCTHCIGQQLVLYLALLSCSLCYVKLHVVHLLLFGQIKKEGRRRNHHPLQC